MGTSAHLRQGLRGLASSLLFGLVLWGCVPTALPATAPPEAEKPAAPQEKPTSPLPAVKKGGILHFAIGTQTYPYNTNAMWLDAEKMPKR